MGDETCRSFLIPNKNDPSTNHVHVDSRNCAYPLFYCCIYFCWNKILEVHQSATESIGVGSLLTSKSFMAGSHGDYIIWKTQTSIGNNLKPFKWTTSALNPQSERKKRANLYLTPTTSLATSPTLHKPQEVSKVQAMGIDVVAFANPWHQWWLREIFFLDGLESFFERKKRPQKKYAVDVIRTLVSWERSLGWFLNPRENQGSLRACSGFKIHLGKSSQIPRWSKTYLIKAFQSTTAFAASRITSLHSFIRWHKLQANLFLELKHARSQNATTWKMCPQIPHDSFGQRY